MKAVFPAMPAWVFMIVSILAVTVLNILGITAVARANFVTSQASVSRIIHSMGRSGVFPAALGRLHPRFRTPVLPVLLTSAVSLLAFALNLLTISSLISFGALVAFSVVNLAVIKHYFLDEKVRGARELIHNLVLPGIGFALTAWLWTSLGGLSFTFGLAWAGVGLIYLAFLTRGFRKPAPQLELKEV